MAGEPTSRPTTDTQVWDVFRAAFDTVLKKEPRIVVLIQKYQENWFGKLLADTGRHISVANDAFTWPVQVEPGKGVRWVHWAAPDEVGIKNNMRMAKETLVHTTYNHAWFRQEITQAMGDGKAMYDLLKTRIASDQHEVLANYEERMWESPANAEEAETYPKSIPFWIQKAPAGTTEGGFVGGNPDGFPEGRGRMSSVTYPLFRNYADLYADFGQDLVRKMRRQDRRIEFNPPAAIVDESGRMQIPQRLQRFTTERVIEAMAEFAETRNENLGYETAEPRWTWRRVAPVWVPLLDADESDPIYSVDTGDFKLVTLRGDFLHQTGPVMLSNQHNGMVTHVDLTFQMVITNPRVHAVISKDV